MAIAHEDAGPKVLPFHLSLLSITVARSLDREYVPGPNAGPELRLKAGARHERTLEAVSSRPWFGEEHPAVPLEKTSGTLQPQQARPVLLPPCSCHEPFMPARLPKTP